MQLFTVDQANRTLPLVRKIVEDVVREHRRCVDNGLAHVFAESGGDLTLASAPDREAELDELAKDLARELDGIVS